MWTPLAIDASGPGSLFATPVARREYELTVRERLFERVEQSIPLGRRGLLRSRIDNLSTLSVGRNDGPGPTTDDPERDVQLIAHRGCGGHYPENTIRAVKQSAPHVDMIEFDVQRCGSGELVVFHDNNLDRLTNASGLVSETEWEKLRELKILDSSEKIPRFDEFLAAVPANTAVNIELKHAEMGDKIVSAAEECDNEVLVSSFWPAAIREVRNHNETIDRAFLINKDTEGGLSIAADMDCKAVNPSVEMALENAFVERAHENGFEVNAWTVDDVEVASRLIDVGVDGIFVDRWDLLHD